MLSLALPRLHMISNPSAQSKLAKEMPMSLITRRGLNAGISSVRSHYAGDLAIMQLQREGAVCWCLLSLPGCESTTGHLYEAQVQLIKGTGQNLKFHVVNPFPIHVTDQTQQSLLIVSLLRSRLQETFRPAETGVHVLHFNLGLLILVLFGDL